MQHVSLCEGSQKSMVYATIFLSILCPQKEIRRQYSEKMGSFVQEKVLGFDQVTSKKEVICEQNYSLAEKFLTSLLRVIISGWKFTLSFS